ATGPYPGAAPGPGPGHPRDPGGGVSTLGKVMDNWRHTGASDGQVHEAPKKTTAGKAKPTSRPPPAVETFTAAELAAMQLPEARYVVWEVIPEGLTVLAGKPKLGKSWLALNLALAVAQGGIALGKINVTKAGVLYLALEDTKRRLQARVRKILSKTQQKAPERLHLTTSWGMPGQDRLKLLSLWLEEHPETRLVIIDTWAKFRPGRIRGSDLYEEDYAHASQLKDLAD